LQTRDILLTATCNGKKVAPTGQAVPSTEMKPGRTAECEYRLVQQVLVVIGGLPATGKSTVAKIVAEQTKTPYLRVDLIEHAIVAWSELSHPLGPVGYAVAYELVREQLALGWT
jgi:hypothetical protein